MTKKILMTVGGTGGHVYPAIALAKQLLEAIPGLELRFAGGKLTANRYFSGSDFQFHSTACATFQSKNPFKIIRSSYSIAQGVMQSRKILKEFQPDLVVGFGSYYTLPILLAAKSKGVPIVLHEANSIPGKVNKLMAPYAAVTGIHFPMTASLLKGHTVEVGMPLREGFQRGSCAPAVARAHYQLHPAKTTLLVFGGSQGAQAINQCVIDALAKKGGRFRSDLQVIHITGTQESVERIRAGYLEHQVLACVKDFEHRMDLAWQAADFVVCRAGAGTIAEAMEFEVPAIVIPFPQAADGHQDKNGLFLTQTVKGGEMYLQKDLNPELLSHVLTSYLEPAKRLERREAIQEYKQKSRHTNFSQLIRTLL